MPNGLKRYRHSGQTHFMVAGVSILLALACCSFAHAQTNKAKAALESLHALRPAATWKAQSAETADVDCDSKPDTIVLGEEKGKVLLGIVWGATTKRTEVMAFSIRRDAQDGFCASPKKIEIESLDCESNEGPIPGCSKVKGCMAFSLSDNECDPFNFYWDSAQNELRWWRL